MWILTLEGSFGFWEGQALEIFIFAIQSIIKGWRAIKFLTALDFNVALGPAITLTMNCNQFMLMFSIVFGSIQNNGPLLWRMFKLSQLYFCELWLPFVFIPENADKLGLRSTGAEQDKCKMFKNA